MKRESRAILFCNGEAERPDLLALTPNDYLIAVDGGLRYMDALGLEPDLLIGDFDSIQPTRIDELTRKGTNILRFDPRKDYTDLELALREAIKRGFQTIVIAFALGGRIDHALGGLGLFSLAHALNDDVDVFFDDGLCRVFYVKDDIHIDTEPGDIISLIPWRNDVTVSETVNLSYPLRGEILYFGGTRGLSNEALADSVSVCISHGELLLIHTRKIK